MERDGMGFPGGEIIIEIRHNNYLKLDSISRYSHVICYHHNNEL